MVLNNAISVSAAGGNRSVFLLHTASPLHQTIRQVLLLVPIIDLRSVMSFCFIAGFGRVKLFNMIKGHQIYFWLESLL